jgi:hypothetical protein
VSASNDHPRDQPIDPQQGTPAIPATNTDAVAAGSRTRAMALLDRSLRGRLPCVTCGYDLHSISILGVCPEFGTAVRATLLAVVDPLAEELRPIERPRLVALGLLVWIIASLLAALVVWRLTWGFVAAVWLEEFTPHPGTAWTTAGGALIWLAGLGTLGLVRPYADFGKWRAISVLCALPLFALLGAMVYLDTAGPIQTGPATIADVWSDTTTSGMRFLAYGLILAIIALLRPTARVLVARSLAIRTGRVDRQTLIAMAAAIGVIALGDAIGALGQPLTGSISETTMFIGASLMVTGGLLFTIGLIGSVVDALRIARAVVAPGPSMSAVLHGPTGTTSPSTARTPSGITAAKRTSDA